MRGAVASRRPLVLTVGHSTRAQKDFVTLLQAHGVKQLVDVRTIPGSRHNPQFNRDRIASALKGAGISYLHMKGLGGFRHAHVNSPNTAWHNANFRGFADYMQTRDFVHSLRRLMKLARHKRTAIMCAEVVPWRCHRSLIADALLARGCAVEEIESLKRTRPHMLTPWACLEGVRITYPSMEATQAKESKKKYDSHTRGKLKRAPRPASSSHGETSITSALMLQSLIPGSPPVGSLRSVGSSHSRRPSLASPCRWVTAPEPQLSSVNCCFWLSLWGSPLDWESRHLRTTRYSRVSQPRSFLRVRVTFRGVWTCF
jgi:hypothetical protein